MTDIILLYGFILFACVIVGFIIRILARGINIFAKPPVVAPVFVAAKACAFASSGLLPLGVLFPELRWYSAGVAGQWAAAALFLAGAIIAVAAMKRLGDDLIFGLPDGDMQSLQTGGIFGISRNPLYLGFVLIILSSCLATPNPFNFATAAVAAVVHHLIILREEEFLLSRYGDVFREYCGRTGRWLLWI